MRPIPRSRVEGVAPSTPEAPDDDHDRDPTRGSPPASIGRDVRSAAAEWPAAAGATGAGAATGPRRAGGADHRPARPRGAAARRPDAAAGRRSAAGGTAAGEGDWRSEWAGTDPLWRLGEEGPRLGFLMPAA